MTMLPGTPAEFTVSPPIGLSFTGNATATTQGNTATIKSNYRTGLLHGVMVNSADEPVQGAGVSANLVGGFGSAGTTTNTNGEYSIPLPEGEYSVYAEATVNEPGFYSIAAETKVTITNETELNFSLPALGTVTITAVDANNTPIANATIMPTGQGPVEGIYHTRNQYGQSTDPTS